MPLIIRHRVCGQKLVRRVWVAALDLENRFPSLSRGIKDYVLESIEPSRL